MRTDLTAKKGKLTKRNCLLLKSFTTLVIFFTKGFFRSHCLTDINKYYHGIKSDTYHKKNIVFYILTIHMSANLWAAGIFGWFSAWGLVICVTGCSSADTTLPQRLFFIYKRCKSVCNVLQTNFCYIC